jgi:hypothetical protein
MKNPRYKSCPYIGLPEARYWKQSVSSVDGTAVDPVVKVPFKISPTDKVATAGSCFAQHIARNLVSRGFNYFVPERAPSHIPLAIAAKYNFGTFSARFGNLYTPRQLLQLFDRAYGDFVPEERPWQHADRYFDPFRPSIEPDGYMNLEHLEADRRRHLACVREMFETLDVFVFTLGLTECWRSKIDGAVLPVAPGCGFGEADDSRYEFYNFSTSEVIADMTSFLKRLRRVNPRSRVILTVSPVPLIATFEDRHVLVSTGYSKAALRVAADELERCFENLAYFPSYEIITGQHSRGSYYSSDLREIDHRGVEHVMRVFFTHFATGGNQVKNANAPIIATDVICDEELLVRGDA